MSKQRYINTEFWADEYILELQSEEKLLFMYFLTNDTTNVAGIYKLAMKKIVFETGLKSAQITRILADFARKRKIFYVGGWVIISNHPRHQKWQERDKIRLGIISVLQEVPRKILEAAATLGYQFDLSQVDKTIIARKHRKAPAHTLCAETHTLCADESAAHTLCEKHNYSDSDLDPDSDLELETDLEDTLSGSDEPDPAVSAFIAQEEREENRIPYAEIVAHLNEKCRSHFRDSSDNIRSLIKARWNAGARLTDFKLVIDIKARQWISDPKMMGYLRPKTLFAAANFDGYLNEALKEQEQQVSCCPECGAKDGYHAESCPRLVRADVKNQQLPPPPETKDEDDIEF